MSNELVQNVLIRKKRRLKAMFEFYASKDDSDDGVHHLDTININECIGMCRVSVNIKYIYIYIFFFFFYTVL